MAFKPLKKGFKPQKVLNFLLGMEEVAFFRLFVTFSHFI